jgi:hypothetical protein
MQLDPVFIVLDDNQPVRFLEEVEALDVRASRTY